MASQTVTPNALARTLSARLKRTVTAKAVRTVARDTLARFDKTKHPAYQGHEYSVTEAATLTKTFATRGTRGRAEAAPKAKAKGQAKRSPRAKATPQSAPETVTATE